MCCKNFWKKIIPFSLALMFSLFIINTLQDRNTGNKNQKNLKTLNKTTYLNEGTGQSGAKSNGEIPFGQECFVCKDGINPNSINELSEVSSPKTKPLQIISKPRANYTDSARENGTQGIVRLRITFLANGQFGAVRPVISLPNGLTEQAVIAAKQIRFEPAKSNGVTQTVTKQIEYSFVIY